MTSASPTSCSFWIPSPDVLRKQEEHELEERKRLDGEKYLRARIEGNIYAEGERPNGERGRIMFKGQGRNPLLVQYPDGQWRPLKDGLSLPPGFEGKGSGVQINFALQPWSNDYSPINWVRFNHALKSSGCVYERELTPEEFAALPGTPMRSRDRKPLLLQYLGAE